MNKSYKVISTIRPIEKHIHSTEKQAQLSRQIQVQVRQLQKQVQQIEKMSKNISTEIIKKIKRDHVQASKIAGKRHGSK